MSGAEFTSPESQSQQEAFLIAGYLSIYILGGLTGIFALYNFLRYKKICCFTCSEFVFIDWIVGFWFFFTLGLFLLSTGKEERVLMLCCSSYGGKTLSEEEGFAALPQTG